MGSVYCTYINGIASCHAYNRCFGGAVGSYHGDEPVAKRLATLIFSHQQQVAQRCPIGKQCSLYTSQLCDASGVDRSRQAYLCSLDCRDDRRVSINTVSVLPFSGPGLAYVRWQWILLKHLHYLSTRAQPTASVVDVVDLIEIINRRFVRTPVVA